MNFNSLLIERHGMTKFTPGQKVRQKGKRRIMEVVGVAGIGAIGVHNVVGTTGTISGRTVCTWMEKGRRKQRGFNDAELELA